MAPPGDGYRPIHTGRARATQANETCCCEWECPHCTQATSKDLRSNLRACVQCGLGLYFDKDVKQATIVHLEEYLFSTEMVAVELFIYVHADA